MRRKHNPGPQVNGVPSDDSGPSSPTSTGAMDSLLEKLRAAAPQARDQRDRRRRARLKERHQVRVASGQRMPEVGEGPTPLDMNGAVVSTDGAAVDVGPTSLNHSEDVADRAASMLQGLRRDGGGGGGGDTDVDLEDSSLGLSIDGGDGGGDRGGGEEDQDATPRASSMRVRRRRESADDERRARRTRRGVASTTPAQEEARGSISSEPIAEVSPSEE